MSSIMHRAISNVLHQVSQESVILGIYEWGSKIYGTVDENSDMDLVVIVDKLDITDTHNLFNYNEGDEHILYQSIGCDIHIISGTQFNKMLADCKLIALECYFQETPVMKYITAVDINKENLRRSISAVASNSWVKAKKKVNLGEIRTGLKSLFHSIRIVNYGTQIAETGKINDFKSCNTVWFDIIEMYGRGMKIEEIQQHYKQPQNERATYFRSLCPLS